ncbi:MAG TPA: DUF4388 domain-containing protein [Candidatus Polarisedimenticolia bacterium]|jgi:hypothetical protein|nr:DUF4388 domain-containing protein [Candidatus Polarisedimenticolia bacterium]
MPSRGVLSGDLASFNLADIFTLLAMGKKTGVLRLTRGAETRTLAWQGGEIVFARSNSVRNSLGNFLVRKGIITPEQNALSAAKIDEATRHGKVLVRMGFLSADQLHWAVKQQVLEIIYSLFHWRTGLFEFVEGAIESQEKITLSMSTTRVIMDGIHRLDEWTKMRSAMPDDTAVPEPLATLKEVLGRADLGADEKKVYPLVDGTRSVGGILEEARLGEFETYAALFQLLSAGMIKLDSDVAAVAS